jgi:hypothetical protein
MTATELEHLKYPIGKRVYNGSLSASQLESCLNEIAFLPNKLTLAVSSLSNEQLDTPYRPEGWTVRQVIHHLCDSHMNAFIRCKLVLSENQPTIKPYAEALWAEMADSKTMAIQPSLDILSGLHQRFHVLLRSLSADDLKKSYIHPQYGKVFTLEEFIHLYAWHSNHHLAHINELKKRSEWL